MALDLDCFEPERGLPGEAVMVREVLRGKRIVLGVTGSIAAFKAVSVASALTQAGALVDVVMTPEATELIRPLSFQALTQRPVAVDMFSMLNQTEISHVSLGHHADVVCIAPATAHTLAKLALGLADDLVTTTCLATRAPLVIAPAMDADMYDHPAVAANVKILRERGATIVEPGYGRMASGLVGQGRLAEPPVIVDTLRIVLARGGDLAGRRVVVTAGGTQEAIDPVRFVSNRSSGKMGYAVAEAARDRGASVVLVTAPTALSAPIGVEVRPVVSAADMHDAVMAALPDADLLIMAAAVADYRPATVAEQKIKKRDDGLTLQLARTTDILAATASLSSERLVRIGFAAESQNLVSNAADKLERKRLDLIVANDISRTDSGFGTDDNAVVLLDRSGGQRELPLLPKREVADRILDEALAIRQSRRA
ncbi:MAG TPA: bifunctional phosphopantothenoylcysteine decarboxylase/phosphopantothenate--cysteine ligase CoaBC [Chloroflexota bacterium]|nr:bifunctional phosphopantothenoylcysteine decarboxylase/phosphopantothenate--cysteine ligase CoaBC [Chloroflexota bacterium]